MATVRTISWIGDASGFVRLIDQTLLPTELRYLDCKTAEDIWEAIKKLRVRGAPAIGIAGAMGVVLGMQALPAQCPADAYADKLRTVAEFLKKSRPTAVNLAWAVDRTVGKVQLHLKQKQRVSSEEMNRILLTEAVAIEEEDRQMCRAIGLAGAGLIEPGHGVLTHCNAGGLATADYGTALAVMFAAAEQGKAFQVFADETRPLLQGARLTTWELLERGIDTTLICDNMAGQVMKEGRIHIVITGADRIAANGDSANKIGTYGVALLAQAHNIPFYIAAPSSTFDLSLPHGDLIPIEQRDAAEVTHGLGKQIAPSGVKVYNPAFDVTPARLIAGIITEKGIIAPVTAANIRKVLQKLGN